MIGKDIRIERIINRNTNRSVIVPMDHGFSMGQIEGLLDMTKVISDVSDGGANAIVLHKGLVKRGHRKHGRNGRGGSDSTADRATPDHHHVRARGTSVPAAGRVGDL